MFRVPLGSLRAHFPSALPLSKVQHGIEEEPAPEGVEGGLGAVQVQARVPSPLVDEGASPSAADESAYIDVHALFLLVRDLDHGVPLPPPFLAPVCLCRLADHDPGLDGVRHGARHGGRLLHALALSDHVLHWLVRRAHQCPLG